MNCTTCNLTGIDPKTRAICAVCNGSPEQEPVLSETFVEKVVKKVAKKK